VKLLSNILNYIAVALDHLVGFFQLGPTNKYFSIVRFPWGLSPPSPW